MPRLIVCLMPVIVLLGLAQMGEAALVITEIMYKPSGVNKTNANTAATSDEWFEVFNAGPSSVNLANIKIDDDADASDGISLNGTLGSGKYAIVANNTAANWATVFGTLPVGTLFVQPAGIWNSLADGGENLTLFSTLTGTNFFTLNYTHPQRNGVSV